MKQAVIFVKSKTNINSLASLCGALEEREDLSDRIEVIFANEDDLLIKITKVEKAVVAFSFMTPDISKVGRQVKKIKKGKPSFLLIAGGPHPSGAYRETLQMGFDFAFVGEGEISFLSFLDLLLRGSKTFGQIKGLGFKKGDELVFTGKAVPVDISCSLPISEKYKVFSPIEITRGCPFGCRFCQTSYVFGRIRHRNIKEIVEATKILVRNNRPDIRFVSPNLLSYGSQDGLKPNLKLLEKLLFSVRSVKGVRKVFAGSFPSEIRPEQVERESLEIIRKYCDNDNLIIGVQSGSDTSLAKMHRGHRLVDVLKAINLALEVGFRLNLDFIFGLPQETKREQQETRQMLKKLAKIENVRIHGHTFMPLPGTPWANKKPGKISPELRELLKSLRKKGKEYGDWEEQERLGQRFSQEN